MSQTYTTSSVRFFDSDSIVDFVLLLAIANVAVSLAEMFFHVTGAMPVGLRLTMTIAVALAIHRMGVTRQNRSHNTIDGFPDPVIHDLQTGIMKRTAFFACFDAAIRKEANGFLMLVHANDIDSIDRRYGDPVGDFFLASLVARFDPTIQNGDLVGQLDRETYGVFLKDRTQDEVALIGRRMCGATLLPLGDSAERAQLSACVGYTEVISKEPILDALERANSALSQAQDDGSTRVEQWQSGKRSGANHIKL